MPEDGSPPPNAPRLRSPPVPPPSPQPSPAPVPLDTAAVAAAGFATVVHSAAVGSTMDEARTLAADHAAALPAVIVADRQTAGRGRRGAGWWQADGALAASLVIAGGAAGAPRPTWALASGVAVAEAIRSLEPAVAALVRWPNDVVAGDRKLAGILVESAPHGRAVVGIGVNTAGSAADAPEPLRHRVVTLPDLIGRTLDRAVLLAAIWSRLAGLLAAADREPEALVRRYRLLCGLEGTVVTLYAGTARHTGICRGISASGGLVIDTAGGRMECISGSLTAPEDAWPGPGAGGDASRAVACAP